MTTTPRKTVGLSALASLLAASTLFAQALLPSAEPKAVIIDENGQAIQGVIIFNNLEHSPRNRFNSESDFGFDVVGQSVPGQTEELTALLVIPKANVRAQVLSAAISYTSGTRLVNLGLYSDNMGAPGTLLPGGLGSTTDIPDADTCCEMAEVTLPGRGVALTKGTRYWMIASADDVTAPNFRGSWRISYRANSAAFSPAVNWQYFFGPWLAARIRGTKTESPVSGEHSKAVVATKEATAIPADATIFTNLGPASTDRYAAGAGVYVTGNSAIDAPEVWEALPFTARKDSHAKTLAAAIGYKSGTKKVNLGIYSDNDGKVGELLPGGQGSTTGIPRFGDCCRLTQVALLGEGVPLKAGSRYWLVASPDNIEAPTFEGIWQNSNLSVGSTQQPEQDAHWFGFSAYWLAAEIRGTVP